MKLFSPLRLRELELKNRVWLAPMCQYSVESRDGVPADWHLVHLGARAAGGFGLVLTEATAVLPEGRISPQDTGLWNDAQQSAWARITAFAHSQHTAIGVQLAHAGRKASTWALALRRAGTIPAAQGGWPPVGPSPVALDGLDTPREMTRDDITDTVRAFAAAAARADRAGFDVVELHAAHGYLIHQFLSPLSNFRTDDYSGSFDNRTRLLVEIVEAVRKEWPGHKPLFVRLSATEWVDGGWTVEDTAELAARIQPLGVDLIDVSSGGVVAPGRITVGPGYQVPFARQVRAAAGIPTGAVGLITEPEQAEGILADGSADAVLLARAALREPSWPLRAAHVFGIARDETPYPTQYLKGAWPVTRATRTEDR
ncbi:NADH:flavin oxidoreductase/NADH oxidase [Amycolatopsis alkalitolerans]|uniref:NADH:flavin oxidoreductase/NADH oxidase n=1 Tax=Amycolatopsis alkalitolerans TaxID=2547244 RepID=A0A5C4MAZ5_9PSEU|nr:NADH:flavin oxidoreductase/NADH oxidase [Amycolatopsis alkalitolerans]TNC29191.1 NADH:flavin oxidoreductase/NADH oxidase [Amycolatopsis alkalitolerans]